MRGGKKIFTIKKLNLEHLAHMSKWNINIILQMHVYILKKC